MAKWESDRVLAKRIQEGSDDACREFDSVYRAKLEWLARQSGIAADDCPDVAQEVLAAAIRQICSGGYRAEASLGTWLRTILKGTVIDFKRSPGKTSIPVPADLDGPASDIILSASLVTPPDQELRIHIREILQSMDRRHRILLILSVVGRLTIADISHKFGWPEGTVSRLRAEAQKIFREKLMQREDFKSPLRQRLVDSGE